MDSKNDRDSEEDHHHYGVLYKAQSHVAVGVSNIVNKS